MIAMAFACINELLDYYKLRKNAKYANKNKKMLHLVSLCFHFFIFIFFFFFSFEMLINTFMIKLYQNLC